MERIHPALAHFPMALLLMSVFFDALAYALRRPVLHVVGFWNLVAGVFGSLAAAWTGYYAGRNPLGVELPTSLLESHTQMAFLAVVLFATLLAGRLLLRQQAITLAARTVPFYLFLAILAGGVLVSAGRSGNRLVFDPAVGLMMAERPSVAVPPDANDSSEAVWVFGPPSTPAYDRPALSSRAARNRASIYLRRVVPGRALVRVRNGCKELHVPLFYENMPVMGIRMDPETGRVLAQSEHPCAREIRLTENDIGPRVLQSLRAAEVGLAAWQGGEGTYWNVPFFTAGRMINMIRISVRDGSIVPLSPPETGRE